MKHLHTLLLSLILLSSISYAQPMNNWNVKVLLDTTAPKHGMYKECHASTLIEVEPGKYQLAWFGGSYEGADDVRIWSSFYDQDSIWTAPVPIANSTTHKGEPQPCWNPVLFKTNDGKIILFYKAGKNPREWYGYEIHSIDGGTHWSEPELLPDGFLGPIKNKPVQLENGSILCPSSVETEDGTWSVHLEITNEYLSKWTKVEIEKDDSVGVIQPSIIRHPDGSIQMLCRSKQNFIYQTWSCDNGLTWTKLEPSSLPNPNSGIDAVALKDGRFILVYNPLLHGKEWYNGRNVLNVAISNDGKNWEDIYQLENEKEGEFSYPAVIQASDETIHITYTYKREKIKYIVLDID